MYGLIGRKLSHSFSPQIHRELADYEYKLYEMEESEVGSFLKNTPFAGMNVTIPYKRTVIPFLDEISDEALKIGAVNTVKRLPDGKLAGDNTDYYGFKYTILSCNVTVKGKKCIVLGSGGASLTAIAVLRDMEAESVTVISRTGKDNYENLCRHYGADIIINTTPVGMYPNCGVAAIDLTNFTKCAFVCDMIYNPAKTALLLQAEKLGIPYRNGLTMLVAQAKKACEIFTDTKIDDSVIDKITSKIEAQTKNIVLIGMPGCGKTTMGTILAEKLCRELLDTDSVITQGYGKPIPEIFAEKGEAFFRELEEAAVMQCGKESSKVIATGGGAILRKSNIDAMRQNGTIIFLNRRISELATDGRPLSASEEKVKKLYAERLPIYKSASDFEFEVEGSPQDLAEKIIKELKL